VAAVHGRRATVTSPDGTEIGLLTAGAGRPLLLVHGGLATAADWGPMWPRLTARHQVTALDRRGRGASGDTPPYALAREFEDVTAVTAHLAAAAGGPVDVLGHSFGALCALGAAAAGAPVRRLALYEPTGPATVPEDWRRRARELAADQPGPVLASFLTEIIGMAPEQARALRDAPGGRDVLPVVAATLSREADALAGADLAGLAAAVTVPVLLLLGADSPAWAAAVTRTLKAALPVAAISRLPGCGHQAIYTAPGRVAAAAGDFFAA
jgi:pimeloyl-ACP methyl ester carboxylesterase